MKRRSVSCAVHTLIRAGAYLETCFVLSLSLWIQESHSTVLGPINQLKVIGDRVVINCSEAMNTPLMSSITSSTIHYRQDTTDSTPYKSNTSGISSSYRQDATDSTPYKSNTSGISSSYGQNTTDSTPYMLNTPSSPSYVTSSTIYSGQGSPSVLSWNYSYSDPANQRVTIVAGCNVINESSAYEIRQTTSSDCNLVINDVTFDRAGYYTCFSGSSNLTSELTVVDQEPAIRFNTTQVTAYSSLNISCSFRYDGPRVVNLRLTSSSNSTRFITRTVTTGRDARVASIYAVIAAEEPGVPSFSCDVISLVNSSAGPSFAANIPVLPTNLLVARSLPFRLSYPVNSTTINIQVPSNRAVYINASIRCVSSCYPSPDYYRWVITPYVAPNRQPRRVKNSSDGWSDSLTSIGLVNCTCVVYNTINGITYNASISSDIVVNPKVTLSLFSPSFGPLAGGTRVTVEGDWDKQQLSVFSVSLDDNIDCTIAEEYPGGIVVETQSSTEERLVNVPLRLTLGVEWQGRVNISLPFENYSFTYLWNPEILDIFPAEHIIDGGTQITVIGNNLTSVANPQISVRVVVIRYGTDNMTSVTSSSNSQPCHVVNATEMLCLVPRVDIPPDFPLLTGSSSVTSKYSALPRNSSAAPRRRRSWKSNDTPVQTVIGSNGKDQVMIYLALVLDGDRDCSSIKNVNCLPFKTITFTYRPDIGFVKDILKFDPDSNEPISIKGKQMTRGCQASDYKVWLSRGYCAVDTLSDNELRCHPPKIEPEKFGNESDICDDNRVHIVVMVNVGYAKYVYSCLDYVHSDNLPLILGLAIGLGLFVLILITSVIVAVAVTRRKRRRGLLEITSRRTYQTGISRNALRPLDSDITETLSSDYLEMYSRSGYLTQIETENNPQSGYLTQIEVGNNPQSDYLTQIERDNNPQSGCLCPIAMDNNPQSGYLNPIAMDNNPQSGYLNPIAKNNNPQSGYLNPITKDNNPQSGYLNPIAKDNNPQSGYLCPIAMDNNP